MTLSVTDFKTKVAGKVHGLTSLAKVPDVYGKMREAAGNLLLRVDPATTIRHARIENAIHDKVYNYTAADDLKGVSKIIDLRPIGERSSQDDVAGRFSKQFDIKKERDTMTVEVIDGVKTLRLSKELTSRITLHRCDSPTLEGTVTLGGDASGLDTDQLDHVSGSGSLKFNLDGLTGTATVTIALDEAIDLSDLEDVGSLFEWLKFPDAARLNSVSLKWGSSSTVYWSKTVTAAHDRAINSDLNNAWALYRHDWSSASETGSPVEADAEAIAYLQITLSYDTGVALTGVKIDNITASLGEAWEILYYSNCLFKGVDGTWKVVPTADTDVIMLDNDGENILVYEFMLLLLQELKGKNAASDYAMFTKKLEGIPGSDDEETMGLYKLYKKNYPSQAIQQQESYYTFGSPEDESGDLGFE